MSGGNAGRREETLSSLSGGQGWLFAEETSLHHGAKSKVSGGLSSGDYGRANGWVGRGRVEVDSGRRQLAGAELVVAELCVPPA